MSTLQGDKGPRRKHARKRPPGVTPWFPLLAVLFVVVIIVVALLVSGAIGGLAGVLGRLAAVLLALGAVIAAIGRFKR